MDCLRPNSGVQRTVLTTVLRVVTPLIVLPIMVAFMCLSWASRRAYLNYRRRKAYMVKSSSSSSGKGDVTVR